jgi:hypothetical protein
MRIGPDGVRSNGDQHPSAERPLTLVVGDSFAFGDDVDDGDSWPSYLERLLDRRVVNGGVPGFGLDQAVLWSERLSEKFLPQTIVVAFIPHDVVRCEFSAWPAGAKPYFDVDESGALRLHELPRSTASGDIQDGIRARPSEHTGYFPHVREILAINPWLDDVLTQELAWPGPITYAHHQGRAVACLLMDRLAALGHTHNARVVVVAYPQRPTLSDSEYSWYESVTALGQDVSPAAEVDLKDAVLACASGKGLETLDLFNAFGKLGIDERRTLYHGHFSPVGNRFVAREIATHLVDRLPALPSAPR